MRNVKRTTVKGRTYFYHRPSGEKLPGDPEICPEAKAAYERLEGKAADAKAGQMIKAHTLGGLLAAYRASPAYLEKAPATRADYQEAMDWLKPLHTSALHQFDTPTITRLRDQAYRTKKRWFANHLLRFLSMLWNWGKPYGHTAMNIVEGVPKIRKPRGERDMNRAWAAEEFDIVMLAMPDHLRVAVALGAYAGLREGDAISIQWAKFDGAVIESRQLKTGAPIWVPCHADLLNLLVAERERRGLGHEHRWQTIVVGERGRPYTESGFRACFFKVIRELVAEGWVQKGLTFHGLRHTAATMLADAGCDTRDIMAVTGHATESMVKRYTERADRKRRAEAAIVKLEAFTAQNRNVARK